MCVGLVDGWVGMESVLLPLLVLGGASIHHSRNLVVRKVLVFVVVVVAVTR